jgi:hypothetical protein
MTLIHVRNTSFVQFRNVQKIKESRDMEQAPQLAGDSSQISLERANHRRLFENYLND